MENRTVSELIKKFENHCVSNNPKPNPCTDCCTKEKFLASSAQIQKYYETRIKVNTSAFWRGSRTSLKTDKYPWNQDGEYDEEDDDVEEEEDLQNEDDLQSNTSQSSFDVFFSATSLAVSLHNAPGPDVPNIFQVPLLQLGDVEKHISTDNEMAAESVSTLYSFASEECDNYLVSEQSDVLGENFDGLCTLFREDAVENKELDHTETEKHLSLSSQSDIPMADVDTLFSKYCNFVIDENVDLKFEEMFRDTFGGNEEEINATARFFAKLMP